MTAVVDDGCGVLFGSEGVGPLACDESCCPFICSNNRCSVRGGERHVTEAMLLLVNQL